MGYDCQILDLEIGFYFFLDYRIICLFVLLYLFIYFLVNLPVFFYLY